MSLANSPGTGSAVSGRLPSYEELARLQMKTLDLLDLLSNAFGDLRRTMEILEGSVREMQTRVDTLEGETAARAYRAFDYFRLCQTFRGSFDEIKQRQSKYVDCFLGRKNVLDVGSGRGEFLDLMAEHGIGAHGVELDFDMVRQGRQRGHNVAHVDIFEHLAAQEDGSFDGMFAAHVAEHMAPERLNHLIHVTAAKLRSGAPFVVETVNPFYPDAFNNFYIDPSHVRPLPPQLVRFMFEQASYDVENLLFSSPSGGQGLPELLDAPGDLPAEIRPYQDYAVIARRR